MRELSVNNKIKSIMYLIIGVLFYELSAKLGGLLLGFHKLSDAEYDAFCQTPAYAVYYVMLSLLHIVFIVWLVQRRGKISLISTIKKKGPKPAAPFFFYAFAFGLAMPLTSLLGTVLSNFMTIDPMQSRIVEQSIPYTILTILIGPVVEEILFRYFIVETLRDEFKPAVVCIITAFIFSVAHSYNIQDLFNMFIMVLPWVILYYTTRNLKYTIGMHIFQNTLACIAVYVVTSAGRVEEVSNDVTKVNGFSVFSIQDLILGAILMTPGIIYYFISFRKLFIKSSEEC